MKYQGTVKWFSNRKGFGFIAPTSEEAPTTEEIFVHQTAIVTDGSYRTLKVRPRSRVCDVIMYDKE
jgi:cold shock CspA family protein